MSMQDVTVFSLRADGDEVVTTNQIVKLLELLDFQIIQPTYDNLDDDIKKLFKPTGMAIAEVPDEDTPKQ